MKQGWIWFIGKTYFMRGKKVIIKKDKILNKWIVWRKEKSILIEVFRGGTKKECKNFIQKEGGKND